jgi:bifunctional non-homologous end joining protein LigD
VATNVEVEVDGRRLSVSNLDKVLYPATGFRKGDVIDYYRRIAPVMLPHLRRRAPTLVRAPNGPDGQVFFEKRCPGHHPDWIATTLVGKYGRHRGYEACLIDDLAALVWVANLAALELHAHQATVDEPDRPTAVVIDLDPGAPAGIIDCCRVALEIRDVLTRLDLDAVVKTSGGKGLHLSIPLNSAGVTADDTTRFALAIGNFLEQSDPRRVTTEMTKAKRPGKVFVDWSQNARFKTTVAAYSLRIRPEPSVSTPITWKEVEEAFDTGVESGLVFDAPAVLERVDDVGDLYAPNLELEQQLPDLGETT